MLEVYNNFIIDSVIAWTNFYVVNKMSILLIILLLWLKYRNDGAALVAHSAQDLQTLLNQFSSAYSDFSLTIRLKKLKF